MHTFAANQIKTSLLNVENCEQSSISRCYRTTILKQHFDGLWRKFNMHFVPHACVFGWQTLNAMFAGLINSVNHTKCETLTVSMKFVWKIICSYAKWLQMWQNNTENNGKFLNSTSKIFPTTKKTQDIRGELQIRYFLLIYFVVDRLSICIFECPFIGKWKNELRNVLFKSSVSCCIDHSLIRIWSYAR